MLLLSRRKALLYLGSGSVGLMGSCLFGCQSSVTRSSRIETKGKPIDLMETVKHLKQIAPSKNSYQYQPPKTSELQAFSHLANAFYSGDFKKAAKLAKTFNYRVIKFREQSTQQTLFGLLENESDKKRVRGWGSYFINPSASAKALVESPHILFDRFTPEIAAQVFLLSKARGFLMAGAHRNANGSGSADVCDPIDSVFQVVHESWSQDGAGTWQLHGFANPLAKGFPKHTQTVLSTGTKNASKAVITLEEILEEQGYSSYVYNELSPESVINQKLNEQVPGTTFSPLAGTQNVQGNYNHQIGVPFLHIELDSDIRSRKNSRGKIASAIASAIN